MKEKLDPYLQPLYDALRDMIPGKKLESLMEEGVVQIAPLAYMRGRTLDHACVILDEAQNTSLSQLKMFLTRMGKDAKFIITGDTSQIDLVRTGDSGLSRCMDLLRNIKGIAFVRFDSGDIIRHPLVKRSWLLSRVYQLPEAPPPPPRPPPKPPKPPPPKPPPPNLPPKPPVPKPPRLLPPRRLAKIINSSMLGPFLLLPPRLVGPFLLLAIYMIRKKKSRIDNKVSTATAPAVLSFPSLAVLYSPTTTALMEFIPALIPS